MKRVFVFLLTVVLCSSILPWMPLKAEAVNEYTINGVTVKYTDYSSSASECWDYANNIYKKIWGKKFNNSFDDSSNSLRNLSDAELTLTEEHLKTYVTNAALGACLRICDSEYLHGTDGWGHSQIIVQKDSNGFTVFEGGLSSGTHRREKYYTWSEYIDTDWLGKYEYIKYIKWPSAPAYSPCDHEKTPGVTAFETSGSEYGKCSKCGYVYDWRSTFNSADAGRYQVTQSSGTTLRRPAPYEDAIASLTLKKGSTVEVLGSWTNAYGNKWYRVVIDGIHYCGYSGHFKFGSYSDLEVTCTNFAPANNAEIPKATYNLTGTVASSNYPLQKIEAYLDGTKYATWTASDKTTMSVNLKDTAINKSLRFSSLATGKHTIVLRVWDYVHSSYVQVHSSVFYTKDASCSHSYSYKATKNPTTSATGTLTGTCSKCSGTKTVTLPKLTTSDYTYKVTKAATCTTTGTGRYTWNTTTYGTFYFDVSIAAKGHSYANATCTKPKTCSTCGTTSGSALGHSYNSGVVTKAATCTAEGVKTYTCTTCKATKTEKIAATGHSYANATCTKPKTCSTCGATSGSALGHNYNSGVITEAATCTAEGVKTYTCTTCKVTKTEKIAAKGHSYANATCTKPKTCSTCGATSGSALGHNYNSGVVTEAATCKNTGTKTYTCTKCGDIKNEVIAKSTTHTYDNSCDTGCNVCGQIRTVSHQYGYSWYTDGNNHWHTCNLCGNIKDKVAHTPGAAATENTAQTCTVCDYIITAALGHTHKFQTEMTSDQEGHWYACEGCSEKKTYAEHCWDNDCDADCNDCGYIRAVTHNYSEKWSMSETKHWYECEVCGIKDATESHVPGMEATADTAQICVVCSYELVPALGITETPPPETTPSTQPSTQPSEDNTAPTEVDKNEEQKNENENPTWIPLLLVVIATVSVSVSATVIILKRKK